MATFVREEGRVSLKVTASEDPRFQCTVVEQGARCDHAVRNKERQWCSMHYARWQRTGTTETKRKNQRRALSARNKVERMRKEGLSVVCLCSHFFANHNTHVGCKEDFCKCRKFESTNLKLYNSVLANMARLGFSDPLNDTSWCNSCGVYIRVGYWHDAMVISRMRDHLISSHLFGRKLRAG